MEQKISISANQVLELLKEEIVDLLTQKQRTALYNAFMKSGSATNPDFEACDFNPDDNDKYILVTVKSPFFKRSCFKSVIITIERDTYTASFTKDEWAAFQPMALEIIKG